MKMTLREIESRLTTFIENELLVAEATVDREDDLLSGEILDSMSLMRLATFVVDEFVIQIEPADYVIENFQNVAALAAFVHRATGR